MVGFNPADAANNLADANEFTFHYGRIQSWDSNAAAGHPSKFTFHYGRIQSRGREFL